jgi:hypothetical protein
LYRWLDQYDAHGFHGLARQKPTNAGKPRVAVSTHFDRAFRALDLPPALLDRIGDAMIRKIRGIWQSRAEAGGWANVRRFAEFELLKLCEIEGISLPATAFRLSRRHVERFADDRIVNVMVNSRKVFDDGKPRIRRDWTALAPMERVVADVKHLDVVLRRTDGSEAWPKVVGFQDGGTGRVFLYPVLLAPGEGVRQEHVAEAFITMATDPMWGFPRGLYLDNGSEFAVFEKIRGALSLVNEDAGREIIYSKPYNASAKTVENAFKRLDQYLFSLLPGYAGGDRMNKKTQTVGKPPESFPGSWDDFCVMLRGLLIAFNARPVGGQWAGRSADSWTCEKQAAGWRPTLVQDEWVLDAAFCVRERRRVDRGALTIAGKRYHHPELSGLPHRADVEVALPWRRAADPLFRLSGGRWAYLAPDHSFPALCKDGAREAGRRQRAYDRAMTARAKAVDSFDPVAATLEMAARHAPPLPSGRSNRLGATGEVRDLAAGLAAGPALPKVTDVTDAQRRREEAETLRLERKFRNAG